MIRLLTLVALALCAVPAHAREPQGVSYMTEAPTALDPAKAYLLFDSSRAKSGMVNISHVFMRVPAQKEVDRFLEAKRAAYQKELPKLRRKARDDQVPSLEEYQFSWSGAENTFAVDMGESLGKSDTFLIEVPPGTYVLYGIAVTTRNLATCNCLGTVKFEARAGVITHLGSLYADKVHKDSPVPYLEDNLGEQMFQYGFILGQALVPADGSTAVPPSLSSLPRVLARYEPVGMFREPGAQSINRLAPIPGVLEYNRGRVVIPGD